MKLSCRILAFNSEGTISETVQSILGQRVLPDEIVLFDNASSDKTVALVRSLGGERIKIVNQPSNIGLFGNANTALEYDDGCQWIHQMHSDDVLEPGFYEIAKKALEREAIGVVAWYCAVQSIDADGQKIGAPGDGTDLYPGG